jgi:hypothetical protein
MEQNPDFYKAVFVTLVSYLIVHAFLDPSSNSTKQWRTVYMLSQTLIFFMLNALKLANTGAQRRARQRRSDVWTIIIFLYFVHSYESVHEVYLV